MAHIVDTRYAGGEFVVLGDALTLPTSSALSMPSQGSLRFNPLSGAIEAFNPASQTWISLSGGGGAGGGVLSGPAGAVAPGNLTVQGDLTVNGNIIGHYFSGTAQYADAVGTGANSGGSGLGGGSSGTPFDLSTYSVTASSTPASRTLAARAGEWLNLKDFTAVGDGQTDDSNAVSAWWSALANSALPGFVPAGTYKITTAAVWDMRYRQHGVTIVGTGTATSVFDLRAVNASPAVRWLCSQGPTAGNRFIGIGFTGALSGTVLQIGQGDFSDPMDGSVIDIAVNNQTSAAGSLCLAANYITASTLWIRAQGGGAQGTALQANQLQSCDVFAGVTGASIGLALTNGASSGNMFRALAANGVGICVNIDSAGARNNSFLGGQFAWTANGINATAGSNNVFFNISAPAAGLLAGSTGVIITNGAASNATILQALGYMPVNRAGDSMAGDLILANGAGLRFATTGGSVNGRLGLDAGNTLALLMDDGGGNARTLFSIPQGTSTALTFAAPVVATLHGNADTATRLQTPVTLSLGGDLAGQVTLADGGTTPTLTARLMAPTQSAYATYNQVSIESSGRVVGGTFIANFGSLTLTGDITGTGSGSIATTLNTTGIAPGTYSAVAVDASGRVYDGVNIGTGLKAIWPAPMMLNVVGDVTGSTMFDGSAATTVTLGLANTIATPGTYVQVTVDGTGRVTNGIVANGFMVDCGLF